MEVFWYHIFFIYIYITKSFFYTKNQVYFLYNKIDFVISK